MLARNTPIILPGKANALPVQNIILIKEEIKACAKPYHGPTKTAHSTFTKCCTGAAFTGPKGIIIKLLNTTLKAMSKAVMVSFLVFIFEYSLLFMSHDVLFHYAYLNFVP